MRLRTLSTSLEGCCWYAKTKAHGSLPQGSKKDPIPKLISETENLLSLQQFFIEQLPNVFITETKPQTAEQQVTLCLEIFQMFKQTFERNEALPTEIR